MSYFMKLLKVLAFAMDKLSATAWFKHRQSKTWNVVRALIDVIFYWEENHCYKAYIELTKENKDVGSKNVH